MSEQRKLAAIMFTDIQDFTTRMNAEEKRGMELLRQHNSIMDEAIRKYQGVLVKNIGDAYLVDFGSAVNAVQAAVEAQDHFAECNSGKSAGEQIMVRISIHLGDVIVQGNDMFGDGVNIASRLQSITPPGGICISREVYAHVKSRMAVRYVPFGPQHLKGIPDPVEVFQVLTSLAPDAKTPALPRPAESKGPPELSIAVLPFANWSDDKENEYFSDGITEDIITDLAKIDSLRVSSRNSVFTYKGKNVDIQKVGSELNVRYVLEGSVRKSGNRLRITAQLIETAQNSHLWAERFDRDLQDVFAIQDEISQHIAGELRIRLTREQQQAITRKETENLEAYDAYLKGIFHGRRRTKSDLDLSVEHLRRALAIDPNFAAAHSALAFSLRFKYAFGLDRDSTLLEEAKRQTEKALALNPQMSEALLMKGLLEREGGNLPGAIQMLQKLIEMDPRYVQAFAYLGNIFREIGDFQKAEEYHSRAIELDPKDFFHPYNLWLDYWFSTDRSKSSELVARAEALIPDHFLVLMSKAYLACAERDEANAFAMINASIKADSNHVDAYGVRGYISLAFGKLDEAYRDFRYVIDNAGETIFTTVHILPYLVCLKKYDDALALIATALRNERWTVGYGSDTKALPLLYRGMIFRLRGEDEAASDSFTAARAASERTLGQFPASATLRATYGIVLAACGEFDPAKREIQTAMNAYPRHTELPIAMARVFALKGDKDKMLLWIRKSLELGKNDYPLIREDIFCTPYRDDAEFLALVGQ